MAPDTSNVKGSAGGDLESGSLGEDFGAVG
jgi:hypothetical protein